MAFPFSRITTQYPQGNSGSRSSSTLSGTKVLCILSIMQIVSTSSHSSRRPRTSHLIDPLPCHNGDLSFVARHGNYTTNSNVNKTGIQAKISKHSVPLVLNSLVYPLVDSWMTKAIGGNLIYHLSPFHKCDHSLAGRISLQYNYNFTVGQLRKRLEAAVWEAR